MFFIQIYKTVNHYHKHCISLITEGIFLRFWLKLMQEMWTISPILYFIISKRDIFLIFIIMSLTQKFIIFIHNPIYSFITTHSVIMRLSTDKFRWLKQYLAVTVWFFKIFNPLEEEQCDVRVLVVRLQTQNLKVYS